MNVRFRHLDYDDATPVEELGAAAIDDLLDRGDLDAWRPLARAILAEPNGQLATTVLRLCDAHPMYGTSALWRTWIGRLRAEQRPVGSLSLADARRTAGLTQEQVAAHMGISQSDVSKLERRTDVRVSTLRSYLGALGWELRLQARAPDGNASDVHLRT